MPLGGVSTGYLNIDTNGTFGLCSIFNSGVPVRGPLRAPILGLNVAGPGANQYFPIGKTWVLATGLRNSLVGVEDAKEIHYWGHFPVLDMEYETSAPIGVGVRMWSPFIPGDVLSSNIPAAVFEVHLRNLSSTPQKGTLAFSFPGPTQAEAQISPESPREGKDFSWFRVNEALAQGLVPASREEISAGTFRGLSVRSDKGTGYALGVIGEEKPRFGSALWIDGYSFISGIRWGGIPRHLPHALEADFSSSMAVDFSLGPGESKVVRIVLAWYSPIWKGEGSHYFARMYTRQYKDAVAVAKAVASDHASLLQRILAWQQAVYTAEEIPLWLRESLVNILHLITKTGYWAVAQPPIGEWCRQEDGLFGMNECPREDPQIECIPCSFYGNIPLVYFFPELALSTLRGYKGYQYPDGQAPWIFGGFTGQTDGAEIATPKPGGQITLNGPCFVSMVDRYWQRTSNDEVLQEFYLSVKKNTTYTMNLKREKPTDWFEWNEWFGLTPHVLGIHLANLRMAQRMAEKVGDTAFVEQCKEWIEDRNAALESQLWEGRYYLASHQPETGKKSDLVFGYQLDGDWICLYQGLPTAFPRNRAKTTLETIRKTCMALTPYGVANFAKPDGSFAPASVGYGSYGYFPPEIFMLGATYMYRGEKDVGLDIIKRCLHAMVVLDGDIWNQSNIMNGRTGEKIYGSDYYQNLMLWAVPAALEGRDLAGACAPGSLVDRIIKAGKKS